MNGPKPPKIAYIDLQGFKASGWLLNIQHGVIQTPYNVVGYITFDSITGYWYQVPHFEGSALA